MIQNRKENLWRIRRVESRDIEKLQPLYDEARAFQLSTGNLSQWEDGYPGRQVILQDFKAGYSYLLEDIANGDLLAVMALIPGADPTYSEIQGQWLNEKNYVTIHRLAARPSIKGGGQELLKWAMANYANIRIDTHNANQPMKHVLMKLGFQYCGVIKLLNGDPRDAYQYYRKKEIEC
ncbi:GNAT family N-acetyltransferase [Facklamia miroungae]|uniref:Protein N-acetyltransferase, RimJ/RimL family n=1 Tax=Facklamia miroungae TaxID=120956 RepID=A0A1G7RKB8_9LACT|nr:GNAT family protein [Facklamia miroungae]SDG11188.1 Protein N-acetyltransferase, RimJ/RimL family [Facklamia miroungae]